MAPPPSILQGPLLAGQTTIITTINSALSVARPPLPLRTRLKLKETNRSETVFGRRLIRGENVRRMVR